MDGLETEEDINKTNDNPAPAEAGPGGNARMDFTYDVHISYVEEDDLTDGTPEETMGWVSQFERFLTMVLKQVLGREPRFTPRSDGAQDGGVLGNTAIFLAVVSPLSQLAEHTRQEVEIFCGEGEAAGPQSHVLNRLYKVVKHPVKPSRQIEALRSLMSYDLYQVDPSSGDAVEINEYFSPDARSHYWMKLVDLAYDIEELLVALGVEERPDDWEEDRKTAIFLAETGFDLAVERNIIKRELQRHGYKVLPSHTLPTNLSDFERTVQEFLAQCSMSIHLVGNNQGFVPDGSDKAVVDLQNRYAARHAQELRNPTQVNGEPVKGSHFTRLIWVPPDMQVMAERQQMFIDNLRRDVEALEGAELLQTPLEDFKTIVRRNLVKIPQNLGEKAAEAVVEGEGHSIYLIYDVVDHEAVKPIEEYLAEQGYRVLHPLFEGDLFALRKQHIEHLRNLDGAVIYYGDVDEQWARMKVLDLVKAPGFGRQHPIHSKALLFQEDKAFDRAFFDNFDTQMLGYSGAMAPETLNPFLEAMNSVL